MTLDATASAAALKLINKYGKLIVYTVTTPGTYNPATSAALPSISNKNIKAIIEDVKGKTLGGGLVEENDKKITIAASGLTFTPSPGHKFKIGSDIFTISEDGVKSVYSGELVAIYEIRGKK